MASEQTRIVIVGAGFFGLATAFELQSRLPEAEITILESQQRVGGMVWSHRRDQYLAECGPMSFPGHRLGVMQLCHKLNLTEQLCRPSDAFNKRYVVHLNGTIYPIPGSLGSAIISPLFGTGSAFRLLTERLRRSGAGKNKLDESLSQFAERRVGLELGQIIADAAATEVFAGDPRAISVRSGFPQHARAEREFGNVLGGMKRIRRAEREAAQKKGITLDDNPTVQYSFAEGMGTLVTALQQTLRKPVEVGVGAQAVQPVPEGSAHRWLIECSDGQTRVADVVILACPAYKQAGMLAELDAELSDLLLNIPYAGIVNLALGYKRIHVPGLVESQSLIIPQRFKRELLKIAFPSSYFPGRAPAGHVLLQITMGGWIRKEMLSWDDDTLVLSARRELRNFLRITKAPQFMHLARWPRAIPQYTLGHSQRVEKIEERVRRHLGLYLGSNAFHGVTLSDAASNAERLAREMRDLVKDR